MCNFIQNWVTVEINIQDKVKEKHLFLKYKSGIEKIW